MSLRDRIEALEAQAGALRVGRFGRDIVDLAGVSAAESRNLHPCDCGKGVNLWGADRGTAACSCTIRKFAAVYGHFPAHETWTDTKPEASP